MSDFHFSPRANRAGEIEWQRWSPQAFERARSENKPILLSISAVWCHWCHVMDETTYSDSGVIGTINERYVPVRVDNDERPDVNARYNMGGWPTTAFLAPDGTTITGATYLPPAQMLRALEDVAGFYREHEDEIAARASELRQRTRPYDIPPAGELRSAAVDDVTHALMAGYDAEYGGFGESPKFPQPELHEFLLAEWRANGDPQLYEAVVRTMREMASGGMYDRVEGGFFRYSTTRDWSVPHFEKMTEDHAGLLRVLAQLQTWTPAQWIRDTLRSSLGYVRTVLRDPSTKLFAGSQDADERYFAAPLEERRKIGAPYVDPRSYTNWTAAMAGAFAWISTALDDETTASEARETLDALHARTSDPEGLLFHVADPDGTARIRGLLGDQVAYVRALLDAHEHLGDGRFLDRAAAHADRIVARFGADDGGFYDRIEFEATIGRLGVADRPIVDNGLFAESLLRLATLTGNARYRDAAERTLLLYARTHAAAGAFGATYARALRRYLQPERAVKIVGDATATSELREAAHRLPSPFVCVRTVQPSAAPEIQLPSAPAPAAYVCVGTSCAAPVSGAGDLRSAYDFAGV